MIFIKILLFLFGFTVVFGTWIGRMFEGHWFIRALDIPRIQFFFTGISTLTAYVLIFTSFNFIDAVFLILLALSVIYQGYRIFPYTPFFPPRIQDVEAHEKEDEFSILVMNVLMTNRKFREAIRLFDEYNPDIIILLEPDKKWEENLKPIQEKYTHVVSCPLENLYGMTLYSKLPLQDSEVKFLVEKNIPSIHTWVKMPSGERIMLRAVHPRPPVPPKKNDRTTARRNELYKIGETVSSNDHPVVVAGDFNDTSWSRTSDLFQKDSGLYDIRIGRGFFNTFHSRYFFVKWPLDHIFVSKHFRFIEMQRLRKCGSDHFPIYARLALVK